MGHVVVVDIHGTAWLPVLQQTQRGFNGRFPLGIKEDLVRTVISPLRADGVDDDSGPEADEPMEHTCRGEYYPNHPAQSHQELPQGHVLFCDRHHQRAGVVLHKDARNPMAARTVVYHPLLEDTCGVNRKKP